MSRCSIRVRLLISCIILLSLAGSSLALEPSWKYSVPNTDIGDIAISSDGSTIAVAAGKIIIFSRNGTVKAKLPYGNNIAMTPDGTKIVSMYYSSIYLFETVGSKISTSNNILEKKWEYSFNDRIRSIDISNDGNTIVAQGAGIFIYNLKGTLIGTNKKAPTLIHVSPRGSPIIGISQSGMQTFTKSGTSSKLYDLSINSEPKFMEIPSSARYVIFNEDQKLHGVTSVNGTELWSVRASGDIRSMAMTPEGSKIISGTENGNIDCFDRNGTLMWSYSGNPEAQQMASVQGVAISDKGSLIAAGSFNGNIVFLNANGNLTGSYQVKDHIRHIAMSSDGLTVVATGDETVYAFYPGGLQDRIAPPTMETKQPVDLPSYTDVSDDQSDSSNTDIIPPISSIPSVTVFPVDTQTEYSIIRTATQSPIGIAVLIFSLMLVIAIRKTF